jgi:hypothetical protein
MFQKILDFLDTWKWFILAFIVGLGWVLIYWGDR